MKINIPEDKSRAEKGRPAESLSVFSEWMPDTRGCHPNGDISYNNTDQQEEKGDEVTSHNETSLPTRSEKKPNRIPPADPRRPTKPTSDAASRGL